jgi:hypothetical protein
MSLYLIVESKLKLSHPMTSLIKELRRVEELQCRLLIDSRPICVYERLLLSFIYRKTLVKLTHELN